MTDIRILHVDDEPDIREIVDVSLGLERRIQDAGLRLGRGCAGGGRRMVAFLILLDVMMPGMDGPTTLAICARIHGRPTSRSCS